MKEKIRKMVTKLADRHQCLLIVESVLSTAAFYATRSSRSPRAVTDTEPTVEDVVLNACNSAKAAAHRHSDLIGCKRPLYGG